MKQIFESPLGNLSYVKTLHLDPEMKGGQFDLIALCDNESYEKNVLAILKDLMEEDPYKLTMSELYYAFTFVKMSTFGPLLSVDITCKNKVWRDTVAGKVETVCNGKNRFQVSLTEGDVVRLPSSFVQPTFTLTMHGQDRTFYVRPPTCKDELDLINFYQEQGVSRESISNYEKDRLHTLDYVRNRGALFMCDAPNSVTSFSDLDKRADFVRALSHESTVRKMQEFLKIIKDLDSYGIHNKEYTIVCKECGEKISFRLPMQAGAAV
jgi:hypothetical protein